jgi:20S proteasome alpha/beta subunit
VEYAQEAVKQGSAAVGLRSKTHAVLLTLKVRRKIVGFAYETDNLVVAAIYGRIGIIPEEDDQD